MMRSVASGCCNLFFDLEGLGNLRSQGTREPAQRIKDAGQRPIFSAAQWDGALCGKANHGRMDRRPFFKVYP